MPYIPVAERRSAQTDPLTVGQLNYALTRKVDAWLNGQGISYTNLNAAIGVLECMKMELARKLLAPYEDRRCAENGEVFSSLL